MSELIEGAIVASKFINQTNRHVFLTGKAGTGKTTFLKHIIKHTHKKAAIVAPTGIAAINAGGTTIHSMFNIPFGSFVPTQNYTQKNNSYIQVTDRHTLFKTQFINNNKRAIIRELELLIIDEVSMLRADVLDAIDAVMRHIRGKSYLPFGGVQILFIGDMYQLPPVVKDNEWQVLGEFYKSIYFFDAQVLQNEPPIYIELDKIYRQNNPEFITVLNNLRNNTITKNDTDILNKYYKPNFKQTVNDNYITLTTHNRKADLINKSFLSELKSPSFFYEAEIKGEFPDNMFPIEKTLELKMGSQVRFLKNDLSGEQKYFNGKLAKVVELTTKEIHVEFEDGKRLKLDEYTWENKKYVLDAGTNEIKEETVGQFIHFPIKLAWSITVHKSQGLTFDKAIIDVVDAFAPGQVYVALSRLRDLSGLILTSPINFTSISSDIKISEFSGTKDLQHDLGVQLANETTKFLKYYLNFCYDFNWLNNSLTRHYKEHFEDHKSKLKVRFTNWMQELIEKTEKLKNQANKFASELNSIIELSQPGWKETLIKRTKDAQGYFTPILKEMSSSVFANMELLKDEKKVKQYIEELAKLEMIFFEQTKKVQKAVGLCEAIINGEEYTKDNIQQILKDNPRDEKVELVVEAKKRPKKGKGEKKEKIDTKQLTFDLYKEGKTVKEIAALRNFAVTTIEGHLAHFVKLKQIETTEFVSEKKIKKILEVAAGIDKPLLGQLKTELGDDYSYNEIRMALASTGEKLIAKA
ncbi:MAG: helix-turn-helix domain-containing protein [Sphingobacteriaceae bacterium]|nr:helix-turn-helix domain-containing protein [Sphingobacteriaceae bacterium]